MALRPSPAAPSRSDWRPRTLRSRVVIWTTASSPVSRWIRAATAIDDIRSRAIGLSVTLTPSTPEALNSRAPSTAEDTSVPRGGSTSAVMTSSSGLASLRLRREVSIGPSARCSTTASTTTDSGREARMRFFPATSRAMARMCSGVVPQQPPTMEAPAATKAAAYSRR